MTNLIPTSKSGALGEAIFYDQNGNYHIDVSDKQNGSDIVTATANFEPIGKRHDAYKIIQPEIIRAYGVSGSHSSLYEIEATLAEILEVIQPDYDGNDGQDKINYQFIGKTAFGNKFTLYDWKEYRQIEKDEPIRWHIGRWDSTDMKDVINTLEYIFQRYVINMR